jgi:hypothetical protein
MSDSGAKYRVMTNYKVTTIEADAIYNYDVYTYAVTFSDGENTFFSLITSEFLASSIITVGYVPKQLVVAGTFPITEVVLDRVNYKLLTNRNQIEMVLENGSLLKKEGKSVHLSFTDKNLVITDIELETNDDLDDTTKYTIELPMLRLDIASIK